MKLYYWREHANFGDALNEWLWPQLLGDILDDDDRALLVGIGTLLRSDMPQRPRMAVFGTGAGYGEHPRIHEGWSVYCVRGPLTASVLGLAPDTAITDGAALIRLLKLPAQPRQYPVSFMPHWESALYWDWAAVCAAGGVHFIDPLGKTEDVLGDIQRSEVVVTEAMHGAIVADALRVPWIPVRFYDQILGFKWNDWCSSLGLSYAPVDLPPLYSEQTFRAVLPKRLRASPYLQRFAHHGSVNRVLDAIGAGAGRLSRDYYRRKAAHIAMLLGRIATRRSPVLSSDNAIETATERLEEQLARLRSDVYAGRFKPPETAGVFRVDGLAGMQLEGST